MHRLFNYAIALAALAVAVLPSPACTPDRGVAVVRVIDGDTIVIQGGERVRYIGIDAPERDEPLGPAATQLNGEMVGGKRVRLEKDVSNRDRYGRLLRYVYVDGTLVEGELVRQGLARVRAYPPDTKYHQELLELEAEAKEAGRGVWAR
jgi:micrococcal nuclease